MTDIQRLKALNLRERFGWFCKNNPKKAFAIFAAVLLSIVIALLIPGIFNFHQTQNAEKYISDSQSRLNHIISTIDEVSDCLGKNAELYKELERYHSRLNKDTESYNGLVSELSDIKKDLKNKETQKALDQFQTDQNGKILFTDKIADLEKDLESLDSDITDVVSIDTYLTSQYSIFNKYKDSIADCLKSRYLNLQIIQSKGKIVSVKNKANQNFTAINNCANDFTNGLGKLDPYTKADQGTLTLAELQGMRQDYLSQSTLLSNMDSSIGTFDQYWNELQEQYYTIVTNRYSTASTDYVTEPNPQYRQWVETETYQDTETYTERVYVGSRIVDDRQEDIYETVVKTRPVTKTRAVTKDNGQPQTISVPYDVYSYYYTVERHTPSGVTESNVYIGKKHEKYDASITVWSYQPTQEIGYTEWKQLWNDNGGILTGMNIAPRLE